MDQKGNDEAEESARPSDHASSSRQTTEQSQSFSPPPGPSGLSFSSPPQSNSVASVSRTTNNPSASASGPNTHHSSRPPTVGNNSNPSLPANNAPLPTSAHHPSTASSSGSCTTPPPSSVTGSSLIRGGQDQDTLARSQDGSQLLGSSSQSLSPGPPPDSLRHDFILPDIQAFIRNDDERRRAEEEREGGEVLTQEESEVGRHEPQSSSTTRDDQNPSHQREEQSITGNQGFTPAAMTELVERTSRHFQRLRAKFMGIPTVPGTESSRSSDEGQAVSLRAAMLRMEQRLNRGVPQSGLSAHTRGPSPPGNQVLPATTTESGDSSSGEGRVPVNPHPRRADPDDTVLGQQNVVEVTMAPGKKDSEDETEDEDSTSPEKLTTSEDSENVSPRPGLSIGPPSWGAETDTSPCTQTTSSWSDRVTSSSSGTSSVGQSVDSQSTQLVLSSTPCEDDVVVLPRLPRLSKMTDRKKRVSEETTTSSTTTTSSSNSAGSLFKTRSKVNFSQRTQEQSLASLEIPLAPQTQTQEMEAVGGASGRLHVLSSLQDEDETQPPESELSSAILNQHCVQESQEDLANEKPSWYATMEASQLSDAAVTPAADEQTPPSNRSADSAASPPRKRRRKESASSDELPEWQKTTEHVQPSPSQAKPSRDSPAQDDASCSPKSKDGSFTLSQTQSSSSSSKSSTLPKSSDSSTPPSSSTSTGSVSSHQLFGSTPSSGSSGQTGYHGDESHTSSQGHSMTQTPSQETGKSPLQTSREVECGPTEEDAVETGSTEGNRGTVDCRHDLSDSGVDGDTSASLLGGDSDNTLSLEVHSPIVIDLTQSQSLLKAPTATNQASESSDVLRTSTDNVGKEEPAKTNVEAFNISPMSQNEERDRRLSECADEPMETDLVTQNSFCLQISPSQSVPPCESEGGRAASDYVLKNGGIEEQRVGGSETVRVEPSRSDLLDTPPAADMCREPVYESLVMDNLSESLLSGGKSQTGKTTSTQSEPSAQSESTPSATPTPTGGTPFQLKLPANSLMVPLSTPSPPLESCPPSSTPSLSPLTSTVNSPTSQCDGHSSPAALVASATSPQPQSESDSITSSTRNTRGSETDTSFALQLDTNTSESSLVSEATTHTQNKMLDFTSDPVPPLNTTVTTPTREGLASEQQQQQDSPATPKTPRKSLSLRDRRRPRRCVMEDKSTAPSASGFVIGMQSQETEQSLDMDSQIPAIAIPGDSQFESSGSSDLPFCISLPDKQQQQDSSNAPPTLKPPPPSKSLFSGFQSGVSSRLTGRDTVEGRTSSCAFGDVFVADKDPYEYNSQSQESEVRFVRPRRQRNKTTSLTDSIDTSGQTLAETLHKESEQVEQEQPLSVSSSDPDRSVVAESQSAREPTASQQDNRTLNSQTNSSASQRSHSQASSTQVHQRPSQDLVTPSNSQTLATSNLSAHPSFQSPLPSTPVEFTSPSTMISPLGLEELKKQVQQEGVNRYELRHVRTVRTIVEQRIVSSEVIENNRVVQGSSRVWPEECEPRVFQEVKVEIAPQSSTSSFRFLSSPPILPATTVIHNVGPSMNIINSPTTLIESPLQPSLSRQEDERSSRAVTPCARRHSNRPPIRRVHPILSCVTRETPSASAPEDTSHDGERADSDPAMPELSTSQSPPTSAPVEQETSSAALEETTAERPSVGVGSTVIAKWKDKCWYMATVTHEGKQGRMRVKYADGDVGSVAASNLLHIDSLKLGVPVLAVPLFSEQSESNSELLQPEAKTNGLFDGFSDETHQSFLLRCADEVREFSSGCLCVGSEAVRMCSDDSPLKTAGMRNRKRKRRSGISTPSSKKRRRSSSPTGGAKTREQLFKGFLFTLTQRHKGDCDTDSPKAAGVDKEITAQQICSRGGRVVESLKPQQVVSGRTFVLAHNFCTTKKFLLGLAMEVPCVSYLWISDSIEQGRVLEYSDYRLPVGVTDSDGTVVHWCPKQRSSLLKGRAVHLIGSEGFKSQWAMIVEACGARQVPRLPTMTARAHTSVQTTVVLCEHRDLVARSLLHQAKNNPDMVHIVTPNWVVQSLIHGCPLSCDNFTIV